MQNKTRYIILALVVIIIGAAAFIAGRLLNGGPNPLGILPFAENGAQSFAVSINMKPAPELPTAQADAVGTFVSRQDNSFTIQTIPMMAVGGTGGQTGGAVVVSGSSSSPDQGGLSVVGPAGSDGPKLEVVVTSSTKIYRDATEMPSEPPSGSTTIQQKVEPGTLDDIRDQTMIMVWGRKSGDRLIADVISFSNPVMFKK